MSHKNHKFPIPASARLKGGYNPAGISSKGVKTTPGSTGTNASSLLNKKRASTFMRRRR